MKTVKTPSMENEHEQNDSLRKKNYRKECSCTRYKYSRCMYTRCSNTRCMYTRCTNTRCCYTRCSNTWCMYTRCSNTWCTKPVAVTLVAHTQIALTQGAITQYVVTLSYLYLSQVIILNNNYSGALYLLQGLPLTPWHFLITVDVWYKVIRIGMPFCHTQGMSY